MIMSWEDWLTLGAALITFVSVGFSIQQAEWVPNMPPLVPTAMAALVIGLFAARVRAHGLLILPVVAILGLCVIVLAVQPYAEGANLADRLADFRLRMSDWWKVVWAGDISNDNLPFVTFIHTLTFVFCVLAAWSIYRWQNAWAAIIPAGVVLLSNIAFMSGQPSGAFLVYLFGSLLLVSRLHIQVSQTRWKRQGTSYPEWVSLSALNLTTVIALVLTVGAWMIPLGTQAAAVEAVVHRVVKPVQGQTEHTFRLFHNIDSRRGSRLHTFGDTMPIQGDIKLGGKILLQVKAPDGDLLRGASYNEYTGNGWKSTERERERIENADLASRESYLSTAVHEMHVTVVDRESTVLTPGIPVGSNLDTYVEVPGEFPGDIERMDSRRALEEGDSYNSVGWESRATEDELRSAGTEYPAWVTERYLQLPANLPPRVGEKAAEVVSGAATPYDQARAIERFLRTFTYDASVEAPPSGRDAVDFLLFDLQRGYFDYQASAMAVMLRTQGVPARVAVGYILDPIDVHLDTYTIRKDDAYSWVEVFFPSYGWVTFNPTQDRPPGGAGGLGALSPSDQIPVNLDELFDLMDGPSASDDEIINALNEPPVIHSDGSPIPWILLVAATTLLAIIAVSAAAGQLAWNWGLAGLNPSAVRWEKVQRLSRFVGFRPRPHETPHEWSQRLGTGIGLETETEQLGRAYEESRYGRPDLARVDDEATARSYAAVRNGLIGRILRRGRDGGRHLPPPA